MNDVLGLANRDTVICLQNVEELGLIDMGTIETQVPFLEAFLTIAKAQLIQSNVNRGSTVFTPCPIDKLKESQLAGHVNGLISKQLKKRFELAKVAGRFNNVVVRQIIGHALAAVNHIQHFPGVQIRQNVTKELWGEDSLPEGVVKRASCHGYPCDCCCCIESHSI
jgi:hypothetical protein